MSQSRLSGRMADLFGHAGIASEVGAYLNKNNKAALVVTNPKGTNNVANTASKMQVYRSTLPDICLIPPIPSGPHHSTMGWYLKDVPVVNITRKETEDILKAHPTYLIFRISSQSSLNVPQYAMSFMPTGTTTPKHLLLEEPRPIYISGIYTPVVEPASRDIYAVDKKSYGQGTMIYDGTKGISFADHAAKIAQKHTIKREHIAKQRDNNTLRKTMASYADPLNIVNPITKWPQYSPTLTRAGAEELLRKPESNKKYLLRKEDTLLRNNKNILLSKRWDIYVISMIYNGDILHHIIKWFPDIYKGSWAVVVQVSNKVEAIWSSYYPTVNELVENIFPVIDGPITLPKAGGGKRRNTRRKNNRKNNRKNKSRKH